MADILVIDDEENLCISVQLAMRRVGHTCRTADTGAAGLEAAEQQLPDLLLVDVNLPDTDGLNLMGEMKRRGMDVPVIVITGYGTIASAVAAMQQGAADYIQKPLSMDELVLAVDRCLENRRIRNQLEAYRQAQQRESDEARIIAECPRMQELLGVARKIASAPVGSEGELPTVLVLGETGTGKEALARYIHTQGPTADRPFVQVNCTAIPENLFESELFGHEAGAFTSARSAKKGLFEMADEGTLFLDEIGDMPLTTQAKLLVAIESGRFRRLGATGERVARVRVMAATNSDLEARIAGREFRADLYYRLKVFCLELPPLRDRGDDVLLLAEHFAGRYARKLHKPIPTLSAETQALIRAYHWPGNVRELSNVLQRAVLLMDDEVLTPAVLNLAPPFAQAPRGKDASPVFDFDGTDCTLAAVERRLIRAALAHTDGNISEAARLLDVSRGSLRHRLEKLGIRTEDER